jgi:hypothetical protein
MSRTDGNYRRTAARGLLGMVLVAGLALVPTVRGQNCESCGKQHCPPYFKYFYERPPKLKFKKACPRPICDPCTLPHYGYYQTCWHPWPFPPDWSHCPTPPPAALVPQAPVGAPQPLREPPLPDEQGPAPKPPVFQPSVLPPVPPPAGLNDRAIPTSGERSTPVGRGAEPSALRRPPAEWLPPPPLPPMPARSADVTSKESQAPPALPSLGINQTPKNLPEAPPSPGTPGEPPMMGGHEPAEPRLAPVPASEPPREAPKEPSGTPLSEHKDGAASPDVVPATPPVPPAAPVAQASLETTSPSVSKPQRPRKVITGPGGSDLKMVNSRRIMLDYDLAGISRPEQTVLELWYTQDGRNWHKDETALKSGSPYEVEVNREGTYGFTLLARRIGEQCVSPTPGEQPQVWVEVDWTRPVVHMVHAKLTGDAHGRELSVVWIATDNNLAQQPITLSWSQSKDGPWKTFATKLENTGRYSWQVPGNVVGRIYIRAEAFDLVGNSGSATMKAPVMIPEVK